MYLSLVELLERKVELGSPSLLLFKYFLVEIRIR